MHVDHIEIKKVLTKVIQLIRQQNQLSINQFFPFDAKGHKPAAYMYMECRARKIFVFSDEMD